MAECRPLATSCAGLMLMPVKPASVSPSWYSAKDRAPAMQPIGPPRSARSAGVRWSSARMPETPRRPPGRRTRKLSAKTAALSPDRLITQLEMITSTELSGSGIASMWPCRNSTLAAPARAALARARLSISSVMSRPYAFPAGPTRRAGSSTSIPPPEPRSRTVSPSRRSAITSGLPQPRLAVTASWGTSPCSLAEYSPAPVPGSSAPAHASPQLGTPQLGTPPAITVSAAWAYRARTCSSSAGVVMASCLPGGGALLRGAADQGADGGQGLQTGAVVRPHPSLVPVDQPGLMQNLHVMADGRLRQVERVVQVADARLAALVRGDQGHQPQPDRIS